MIKRLVILSVLTLFLVVPSGEVSADGVTIQTNVAPMRIIVVNRKGDIVKIISNTSRDVRPHVRLRKITGPEVEFNASAQAHYRKLLPQLDFSHAGVIYSKVAINKS